MPDLLLSYQGGRRPKSATWSFDCIRITIFDRILDRDDVLVMMAPDPIDDRGQGRALT